MSAWDDTGLAEGEEDYWIEAGFDADSAGAGSKQAGPPVEPPALASGERPAGTPRRHWRSMTRASLPTRRHASAMRLSPQPPLPRRSRRTGRRY